MPFFNGVYWQVYDPLFVAKAQQTMQLAQIAMRRLERIGRQGTREYEGTMHIFVISREYFAIGTQQFNMDLHRASLVLDFLLRHVLGEYFGVAIPRL